MNMGRYFLLAFIYFIPFLALAQDDCKNNTPYMELEFSYGSSISFNFNTLSDYRNGVDIYNAARLTFYSNFPWRMFVQSNTTTFNQLSGPEQTPMPASILQFKTPYSGGWIPLSNNSKDFANGKKTGPCKAGDTDFSSNTDCMTARDGTLKKCNAIDFDYRLNPKFDYSEGRYQIQLTYTITAE